MADEPYITQADAENYLRLVQEDTWGITPGAPRTYRLIDRKTGSAWFDGTSAQFENCFGHVGGEEQAIFAFAKEEDSYVEITEHPTPVRLADLLDGFKQRWVEPPAHSAVVRRDGNVLYARFDRQDD